MLSQKLIEKSHTYAVCAQSGDILPGEAFTGVRFAWSSPACALTESAVVCCGKVSDDELLFRTADGRYYFSVRDGWGEEDGILYGIAKGFVFDFGHPTSNETILSECGSALGDYHGWAGAMAHQCKKRVLETISVVMRQFESNPKTK